MVCPAAELIWNFEALWRNPTPNSPILQARNVEWETTMPPRGVSRASGGCTTMARNTGRGLISYSGGVAYSEMSSPSVSVIVSPDKRGVTDTVHETQRTHTHISRCRRRNVNTARPFYPRLPPLLPLIRQTHIEDQTLNFQTPGGCWDFLVTPSSLSTS